MCRFLLVQAGRSFFELQHAMSTQSCSWQQQHCIFGCVALIDVMHVLLYELCDFRSGVMAGAVQQTSHTYNWLFLFYRFVVGVLFAELMVGILIATFGEASSQDIGAEGEILHEFKDDLEVLSHDGQVEFVKGLGIPAQFSLDTASAIGFPPSAIEEPFDGFDTPIKSFDR